jgi:hypothetical protein
VHVPLPHRGDLALLHPGPNPLAHVIHRQRGELVRDAHALDLLLGLDRARLSQKR